MSELHVSGVLVQSRLDCLGQTLRSLESLPGVEVCTSTGDGKIVTVVERDSDADLTDTFNEIRNSDGVLSASLVYHYSDRSNARDEEVTS
jgi:nitrate reductase NapAB chaperone NapD